MGGNCLPFLFTLGYIVYVVIEKEKTMNTIDNFDLLADLLPLHSSDPDEFWIVRIIKRKKDDPNLEKNSKSLKLYHVKDREELLAMKDKIVKYAEEHNARAYFNPNPKSWKKVTIQAMKELANIIEQEDYQRSWRVIDKVIDSGCNYGSDKTWVIDLDDFTPKEIEDIIKLIRHIYRSYNTYSVLDPILEKVPTIHGWHLLTRPFNVDDFKKCDWPEKLCPEIKKNNPTLLYYGTDK